jgi:hypothetical protein
MSENELFLHDVRLQERFLSDGTLAPELHKKHLEALPDLADMCEEFDLEQPALAKEQAEPPPAPALAEVAPPVGIPAVSPFVTPAEAGPPAQPAPPAPVPAANPFGAPAAPPAPEAAPPAPEARPEPAAAPDPHGPASIPPPTASVDADWGDS